MYPVFAIDHTAGPGNPCWIQYEGRDSIPSQQHPSLSHNGQELTVNPEGSRLDNSAKAKRSFRVRLTKAHFHRRPARKAKLNKRRANRSPSDKSSIGPYLLSPGTDGLPAADWDPCRPYPRTDSLDIAKPSALNLGLTQLTLYLRNDLLEQGCKAVIHLIRPQSRRHCHRNNISNPKLGNKG